MYKILIADDDAIIRRGLIKTIEWEKYGIAVEAVASDGYEALEMLEQCHPQLLLTDIRMPVMDGIQLMKIVRQKYPEIQIILLTAYEDFEYSREAIKNRACDYLLKPINKQELLNTVLCAKKQQEEKIRRIHQRNRSIPLFKNKFIEEVLLGYYPPNKIKEVVNDLELNIENENVIALELSVLNWRSSDEGIDYEIMKYAVYNCIQEIAENTKDCSTEVFLDRKANIYVTLSGNKELVEKAQWLSRKLKKQIKEILNLETEIGISREHSSVEELRDAILEAKGNVENQILPGRKRKLQKANKELIHEVILGNMVQANRILQQCMADAAEEKYSMGEFRMWAIGLIAGILQEMGEWNELEEYNDYYEYCNKICRQSDVEHVTEIIRQLVNNICKNLLEEQSDSKTILAQKAEKIIRNEYNNCNLTLNTVAENLHVSPVYLSVLFKQSIGKNFSDYLFEIRMEQARMLVENTNLKIYEIGEKVGYNNANYFCGLFKKKYGMTISEYKKEKAKHDN